MKIFATATLLLSTVTHGFSPVSRSIGARSINLSSSHLKSETTRIAEKVLLNPKWPEEWPYTAKDLARMDESQDTVFYESPRLYV